MKPAGRYDRIIVIQRASLVDDGFTRKAGNWADVARLFARREDASDGERIRVQQLGAELTTRFAVRWSSVTAGIRASDRILHEGLTFAIVGLKEVGRREEIEITAAVAPAQ